MRKTRFLRAHFPSSGKFWTEISLLRVSELPPFSQKPVCSKSFGQWLSSMMSFDIPPARPPCIQGWRNTLFFLPVETRRLEVERLLFASSYKREINSRDKINSRNSTRALFFAPCWYRRYECRSRYTISSFTGVYDPCPHLIFHMKPWMFMSRRVVWWYGERQEQNLYLHNITCSLSHIYSDDIRNVTE